MPVLATREWDEFLQKFPNAHLLQTSKWGKLKSEFGWESTHVVDGSVGAQILFRKLSFFSIAYIPKGPIGDGWNNLIPVIHAECKKRKTILLMIEPDLWEVEDDKIQPFLALQGLKDFQAGEYPVQPRRTIVIDINKTDAQLLSAMKQKTRYNIHLAEKRGIQVKMSADLACFNQLMQVTGNRDNFAVHHPGYYEAAFKLFEPDGNCALMIAEFKGEPLAGLLVFRNGDRAFYFYGASSDHYREFMPAYLLQWEAIQWAKRQGCRTYDLWGVPDEDEKVLEANFTSNDQGLWGVYRFKRGFGGTVKRSIGSFEYEYIPTVCRLYRYLRLKRGLREQCLAGIKRLPNFLCRIFYSQNNGQK